MVTMSAATPGTTYVMAASRASAVRFRRSRFSSRVSFLGYAWQEWAALMGEARWVMWKVVEVARARWGRTSPCRAAAGPW